MNYFSSPGCPESDKTPLSLEEKIDILYVKVARQFRTTKEEINTKSRVSNISEARGVMAYIIHKVYGITQVKTGIILGRDHATVRHLSIKISGFIEFNQEYERKISYIINSVR